MNPDHKAFYEGIFVSVIVLAIFFIVIILLYENYTLQTSDVRNQTYYQNVLPSKQCQGVALSDMNRSRLIQFTGSMRPYIYGEDILITIKYNPERDLVLGDVVTQNHILHRIVAINYIKENYQTKGDNNERKDSGWTNFNETKRVICGILRGTE